MNDQRDAVAEPARAPEGWAQGSRAARAFRQSLLVSAIGLAWLTLAVPLVFGAQGLVVAAVRGRPLRGAWDDYAYFALIAYAVGAVLIVFGAAPKYARLHRNGRATWGRVLLLCALPALLVPFLPLLISVGVLLVALIVASATHLSWQKLHPPASASGAPSPR